MRHLLNFAGAAWLVLVSGCATSSTDYSRNAEPAHICHVCRYHNDLACVCVKVTESTPKTEYQGQTYFFCSEDCKMTFLKKPEKYLPRH